MLESELYDREFDDNAKGARTGADVSTGVPAAVFQPPQVVFQPPTAPPDSGPRSRPAARAADRPAEEPAQDRADDGDGDGEAGAAESRRRRRRPSRSRVRAGAGAESDDLDEPNDQLTTDSPADAEETPAPTRSRPRTRSRRSSAAAVADEAGTAAESDAGADAEAEAADGDEEEAADGTGTSSRRRRRKRRRGSADGAGPEDLGPDDPPDTVVHVREPSPADDVRAVKGSTRLEAKKQRRREGRETGRRRLPIITESEFLARRESVERTMVVRQRNDRTQIAVLEDGVLVEHYVNRSSHQSYVGNVYLGKVQNVLPSMEAAFVDIGKGRNAVLYAGEVNFDVSGLEGQPKRIESALKAGQSLIVQVTKDPVGHKGARLTSQVSLPGRYLVYVPGASMTGISRKLPDTERNRLKQILKKVMPENAGVIVRTAAEGAAEEELARDVSRLAAQWEAIEKKSKTASAPSLLYSEPDLTIRVIRDVFNEDFSKLTVAGGAAWGVVDEYVKYVAPHLAERLTRWQPGDDVFAANRIDEQLAKALERKVWLPSGGSLVIDKTEAMTVIDVNTGKFTGQGGNLEETVTRNNLEAAEEIVRQLRLRDVGGIVVIDFIDMVLESNRELVLRRLLECLARDRTKHQVAEVTSLGLVQMTRKRVGAGLLEAFSQPCECCSGRGVIVTYDPDSDGQVPHTHGQPASPGAGQAGHGQGQGSGSGHGTNGGNGHDTGAGNGGSGGVSSGRSSRSRRGSRSRGSGTTVAAATAAPAPAPAPASGPVPAVAAANVAAIAAVAAGAVPSASDIPDSPAAAPPEPAPQPSHTPQPAQSPPAYGSAREAFRAAGPPSADPSAAESNGHIAARGGGYVQSQLDDIVPSPSTPQPPPPSTSSNPTDPSQPPDTSQPTGNTSQPAGTSQPTSASQHISATSQGTSAPQATDTSRATDIPQGASASQSTSAPQDAETSQHPSAPQAAQAPEGSDAPQGASRGRRGVRRRRPAAASATEPDAEAPDPQASDVSLPLQSSVVDQG